MVEIVGVRFRDTGKMYYFKPDGINLNIDDFVVVETTRGVECGKVVLANRKVNDDKVVAPLKTVIRKVTDNDIKRVDENRKKEKQAFKLCLERIAKHELDMKLIDVEYTFDNNKILFYFTADGRIDFRELVKDLANVFKTRIELRQIGVRDEAKMLGGLGICGKPFCCATFLDDFHPVSIKMAKEQGMSLNPTKISGSCGRLMCCLKYEQEAYLDLLKNTPKIGAIVDTVEGRGVVEDLNLLTSKLSIKLDKNPDGPPIVVFVRDVKLIKDGKIKLEKEEIEKLKELEEN